MLEQCVHTRAQICVLLWWRLNGSNASLIECQITISTTSSEWFINLRSGYIFVSLVDLSRGKGETTNRDPIVADIRRYKSDGTTWADYSLLQANTLSDASGFTCTSSVTMNEKFQYRKSES